MEQSMTGQSATGKRTGGVERWLAIFSLILLALALMTFVYELLVALNSGSYRVIASGELWFRLHPTSLNLAQAVTQRYVHPGLWDPVIVGMLQWPAWSILGAPGAVLVLLFGPSWNRKRG